MEIHHNKKITNNELHNNTNHFNKLIKDKYMKQKLENAIEYAEDMLKEYKTIGSDGVFAIMHIERELEHARKVLKTFDKRSEIEVKEIIESLNDIS